jgi:hypothetical protein
MPKHFRPIAGQRDARFAAALAGQRFEDIGPEDVARIKALPAPPPPPSWAPRSHRHIGRPVFEYAGPREPYRPRRPAEARS